MTVPKFRAYNPATSDEIKCPARSHQQTRKREEGHHGPKRRSNENALARTSIENQDSKRIY